MAEIKNIIEEKGRTFTGLDLTVDLKNLDDIINKKIQKEGIKDDGYASSNSSSFEFEARGVAIERDALSKEEREILQKSYGEAYLDCGDKCYIITHVKPKSGMEIFIEKASEVASLGVGVLGVGGVMAGGAALSAPFATAATSLTLSAEGLIVGGFAVGGIGAGLVASSFVIQKLPMIKDKILDMVNGDEKLEAIAMYEKIKTENIDTKEIEKFIKIDNNELLNKIKTARQNPKNEKNNTLKS